MEEDNIYIEIQDPNLVRKEILESTADSLKLMKDLEEDKNRFIEEEELFKRFKNKMVHVRTSINNLIKILPEINKMNLPKKEVKEITVKTHKKIVKTEADKLKDEIYEIERKLNSL